MFLLYEYDIFWAFLIISSVIPILSFLIFGALNQWGMLGYNFESSYYYMFALIFVVFDVETVFLYPWAMSFNVFGASIFIEALIFVLILIAGLIYAWRKGARVVLALEYSSNNK
ncbi:hypothetical protein UlMin_035646 [Ulmus minor]